MQNAVTVNVSMALRFSAQIIISIAIVFAIQWLCSCFRPHAWKRYRSDSLSRDKISTGRLRGWMPCRVLAEARSSATG